jgi:hypothetical protein
LIILTARRGPLIVAGMDVGTLIAAPREQAGA